ncbi:MAG: TonB-dependent receptor [Nevskia sp.]
MHLKPTRFAVLLAGFVASYGASAQQAVTAVDVAAVDVLAASQAAAGTSDIGRISVVGDEGPSATGLITPEETPKARSSVDRSRIDKQSPTSNPFQALSLLPGVNTYSNDSSGLFGGNIRVRGFNSDELGFTVDGVPVNDSGNFAVFPQEYADTENLCNIFVTQGSVDTEAPHVGASGGNIGLTSCDPHDKASLTGAYTGGSLKLSKSYAKIETGLIGNRWKSYVSYSKAQIDKFKGDGRADRDHVDFKTAFDLGGGSRITGGVIYNRAINNNLRTLTYAQADANRTLDFGVAPPSHLAPVNGTAQLENVPADNYYAFSLNPFRNYIASINGNFQLTPTLRFDWSPYLWHGYGTGGNQLFAQQEGTAGAGSTRLGGGYRDINGDGDTRDRVLIYSSSVTTTYRPGVTLKLTKQWDNQTIVVGYWAERAHHRQTGPGQRIFGSSGLLADRTQDLYLDTPSAQLRLADGRIAEFRDWLTVSTGKSLFVSDAISLFNDKLVITPGFRHSGEDRDFTNYPNTGGGGGGFYRVKTAAVKNLPSLGINYHLTDTQSVYANGTRNFRVPSNFTYSGLATGGTFVNGNLVGYTVGRANVTPETSNNFETGYRYAGQRVTFSSAAFYNRFQNRIARSFDQDRQTITDFNVGDSKSYGVELEGGWNFLPHFTAYSSASYIRSEISGNNVAISSSPAGVVYAQTAGKQFPDTPNWLGALNIQYARDSYYVFVEGKYTGRRQSTLVNDQSIGGYGVMNVGAGYTVPKFWLLQAIKLQAVASNITNQDYLSLNAGSGSGFTTNSQGAGARAPSYYVSAPVSFALTLSTEFGK